MNATDRLVTLALIWLSAQTATRVRYVPATNQTAEAVAEQIEWRWVELTNR
jgi:hypothetical protein